MKINPCERNTGREKTYKFIRKGVFLYLGIDIFLLCNCLMFFGSIAENTCSPNLVIFAPVCLSNVTLVTPDRKTGTNISENFQSLESKPLFRLLVRILVKQLAKFCCSVCPLYYGPIPVKRTFCWEIELRITSNAIIASLVGFCVQQLRHTL